MKLKNLVITLLCSATLPAFSGNIELKNGTNLVIGTTTATTNGATLYAGRYDPGNTLTITDGGTVAANTGFIGQYSDDNSILVTGTNSSLRLEESLTIGEGKNNTLAVENAGWVSIGATNGMAGAITIGNTNSTAKLSIENSSIAQAKLLYVGMQTNESGSVTLSGSGTKLNISSNAYLGTVGSDNTITVSDGASFVVSNRLEVGSATSSNNVLNVNRGGKVVVVNEAEVLNPSENQIRVSDGGQLTYIGDADLDGAATKGHVFESGSTLEVGGALQFDKMDTGISLILNGDLNTNLVSTWDTGTDEMYVGKSNDNNTLTIEGGASATAGDTAHIGENSDNNAVNVSGAGSEFTVKDQLIVGMKGDQNMLSLAEGGSTTIANNLRVGHSRGSDNNEISVSGSNSTLSVGGSAIIGESGSANRFGLVDGQVTVADDFIVGSGSIGNRYTQTGGTNTVSGAFVIGETEDASGQTAWIPDGEETTGNLAVVGENAVLNVHQDLTVGKEGSGSILTIRGGGVVNIDGGVVIGESVKDNYIYLRRGDPDTLFNVASNLVVGKEGGDNHFEVYGGTANIGGDLCLGASTNQHELENSVIVSTTNAVLNVAGAIRVGTSNSVNTLNLFTGAKASAQDLFIGIEGGVSSNNVVSIKGVGSRMNLRNGIDVGRGGNALKVENDAWLTIGELTTANQPSPIDGAIAVGSTNDITGLVVHKNSSVEAGYVYIGVETNQIGSILVSGSNSLLKAMHEIIVGLDGSSNTLTIADGGKMEGDLVIGQNAGANNNTVTLAGSDSMLSAGNITIGGENNSGNTLNLTNGTILTTTGNLTITTNNALNLNRGATFRTAGDFNLVVQSTKGFNFNGGATLEVGGILTATNVVEEGRGLVLDGGQWNVGTNLFIGTNTDSNRISVIGDGAQLTATGIEIGSASTTNNTLLIKDGGNVTIEESLLVADGNTLKLGSNGTLEVVGDFDTQALSADAFVFGSNATLRVGGVMTTSTNQNTIQKGQIIVLDGGLSTNHVASWNLGTDLYIGRDLGEGTLSILNSGTVENVSAFIGNGASSNSSVLVSGGGSLWNIANNLTMGGTTPNGNNRLRVLEGATVSVGSNMALKNGSTLEIGTNSFIEVSDNYSQDESSVLDITAWRASDGSLVVGKKAAFSNDTTILIRSDGTIDPDSSYKYVIIGADTLQVGTSNDLNSISIDLLGFAEGATNYVDGNELIVEGEADSLASIIGAEPGSQLEEVSAEIDELASGSDPVAVGMRRELIAVGQSESAQVMNNYYGKKTSSAPSHNLINMGIASVASKLTIRGDNTRARMAAKTAPAGAAGPHSEDQQLQGWIVGYGSKGTKDADHGFNGYDVDLAGFVIGADLAVSKNILIGLAGGSSSGSSDSDNGASSDTKTTYGALYASLGTRDWFLDGSMIYGSSSIDTTLGSTFDTTASYDAQNIAFYLGGGKEIIGKYLILTPQASLLANYYQQDAYTEKSTSALPRSVDSFDALYVQSSLGCNLGIYMGMGDMTLKPEVRAHWLHEFNASDESLPFSLAGNTGNLSMLLQAPEEDILKLGAGVVTKVTEFLELRADLDTRWGSSYSDYIFSGSLRYQF